MKDLLVHDRRLLGSTAPGNYAHFDVDQTTPLTYFVSRTLQEASAYHDEIRLLIFAHGYEAPGLGGGFGIQFCRDDLTLDTMGALSPLRGHIGGGILLFSCATAHIAPGSAARGGSGDGNIFCSRMAQITGTTVTAGTMEQTNLVFCINKHLKIVSYLPWRGTVLTYGPSGAVLSVHDYPTEIRITE